MKTTQNSNDIFLAQWFEGELSDADLKEIVSKEDYVAFLKIRAGIEVYEKLEQPMDETFASIKTTIQRKSKQKKSSRVIPLFAKIAIAVAASLLLFFSINNFLVPSDITFQSNFGEQKIATLLDNSEVILNANSSISFNESDWKKNRNVSLTGEAFFKVQKGSTFTVKTAVGDVTVLGTQFNVYASKNFFEVVCFQGKVWVKTNHQEFVITSNQSVRNNQGKITQNNLNDLPVSPYWTTGQTSFKSVPLKEVIVSLHNQFNKDFDASKIDTSILFTGSFDNKNLELALASVFEAVNVVYEINGNKIILSK
ncbi:MAG: hypothetical protein GW772_11105 [Flavobacteriia bacterium]|nr:hypothetical protein [Flavobacteriia bacterium]OIP46760.1 MAG: hypothetical protein AUK46_07990 [Flavobacteriaceae bacterium CG2_30_31_66]PIV95816.1 MAG: hypothetical protein COW43_11825 [Flavobacteriaceae bacterium CG17_big_fil_post_rev_8_21_14_2_50_31_13]PIY16115.1 MAG: hypothetical protein COZ16_00735 [Flavobacteriaceae bacterium CG_4_10_14_3_um_filter_31_253]PIZ11331.1 MAG: hypothetical protein COY55_05475 [Flavobacteriaceae bacterium CG_4_10_14_0_8_um_filter_31_99]PJC10490.1 MAG: hypot